jgi:hypothetical protein
VLDRCPIPLIESRLHDSNAVRFGGGTFLSLEFPLSEFGPAVAAVQQGSASNLLQRKIHRDENAGCIVTATQTALGFMIDQAVVLRCRFPTHTVNQPDRFHTPIFLPARADASLIVTQTESPDHPPFINAETKGPVILRPVFQA